jgi:hypothetical protein
VLGSFLSSRGRDGRSVGPVEGSDWSEEEEGGSEDEGGDGEENAAEDEDAVVQWDLVRIALCPAFCLCS